MKFFSLFKKELKEMLTGQLILSMVVSIALFMILGNVMGDITEKATKSSGSVVICDLDRSETSKEAISMLETMGMEVISVDGETEVELARKAGEEDHSTLLVIEKGFEEGIAKGESQKLRIISSLNSYAAMSNMDSSAQSALFLIGDWISTRLITAGASYLDPAFVKNPVVATDVTVAKGNSAEINSAILQQYSMSQSMLVPIIVFILITFVTQLNAAAIANEKNDKTLETLLSAPVSRLSVLGSKMAASGVLAIGMAGAYLIGLSSYMGGMMGGISGDALAGALGQGLSIADALKTLGLNISIPQYLLLGLQLFLTIMITLALSLILGALAKDLKAAQSLTMPIMFLAMVPYFITMLMDINELPLLVQAVVYIIPFSHTFTATSNLIFGNDLIFWLGALYQLILLVVIMYIAVRIFSSDKLFTMSIDLTRKRKQKKQKEN